PTRRSSDLSERIEAGTSASVMQARTREPPEGFRRSIPISDRSLDDRVGARALVRDALEFRVAAVCVHCALLELLHARRPRRLVLTDERAAVRILAAEPVAAFVAGL